MIAVVPGLIVNRRHAGDPVEHFPEGFCIVVANIVHDFVHRFAGAFKGFFGNFDFNPLQIIEWCNAGCFYEPSIKIPSANVEFSRQKLHGNFVLVIFLDVGLCF